MVWAENANPDPRLHNRLKEVSEKLDMPPLKAELRARRRLGRQLHAEPARHGAAHVPADGREPWPRAGARRRAAGWRSATAHDAGAAAPDRGAVGRVAARQIRCRQGSRRSGRRDRRPRRRGHARGRADAAAATAAGARSGFQPAGFFAARSEPAVDAMRALAANGSFHVALLDGVTGSGKTEVYFEAVAEIDPPRQAGADPDAGDRAHRPVSRSLRATLRRAAAGMAFRVDAAHPRAQLGGDRGRRARRSWSAHARHCFCPTPISA